MKCLTPGETAEILRCDRDKVGTLIQNGELRAINVGLGKHKPRWVIKPEDLEAFLNSRANFGGGDRKPKAPRALPPVKDYFAGSQEMKIPAELRAEDLTAIIDTREQLPLDLSPLQVVRGTLPTGDYSLRGLEHVISLERKSLDDLLCCCGQERERFDREVIRLLAYPVRALLIEATWADLEAGNWKSKVTSAAALGSCLGWLAMGLPVVMCGNHERAGRFAARIMYTAARRRWRESRELISNYVEETSPLNAKGPPQQGDPNACS